MFFIWTVDTVEENVCPHKVRLIAILQSTGLVKSYVLTHLCYHFILSFPWRLHRRLDFFHRILCFLELKITRLIATGVYLFFVGLTLFLAFYPQKILARGFLMLLSIVVQFLALCK